MFAGQELSAAGQETVLAEPNADAVKPQPADIGTAAAAAKSMTQIPAISSVLR